MASTAAVAVLSQLRQQAYPLAMEIPLFTPHARAGAIAGDWLGGFPRSLARQALLAAAFAAIVLLLVTTIPAWAAFRGGSSTTSSTALHSSAGVTGTSMTRVPDLSAATFVGNVPFVQQIRYFDSLTSSATTGAPSAARFVQGARESSVINLFQDVGMQVALPYLNDAVANKQQIDAWTAAVREQQRQAQLQAARRTAVATNGPAWRAPAVAGGTTLRSTVTFYACIGNGFCGNMANGQKPFLGAAACSSNLPMGTRFIVRDDPAQRVFTCLDRGALSSTWVDVWFYDIADGWAWQSIVGTSSEIVILD